MNHYTLSDGTQVPLPCYRYDRVKKQYYQVCTPKWALVVSTPKAAALNRIGTAVADNAFSWGTESTTQEQFDAAYWGVLNIIADVMGGEVKGE